ncbi:hypothetical protein BT96DRAFT_1001541 [Gymnopus androsaceus JB14]|uniref:Uncharacterized protein n=1 Tax=Gymnopus androsaceus JB14 TaxID=1447944 RepID=A0A6A4H219_9AGAR|nr:hypothetical protein BT96DRAFT_1001541 [Gymnopus androsaceus JB14]
MTYIEQPRTYSADYPEKVLLASIKNMGTHLCPRCNISKDQVHKLGTQNDMKNREILRRLDSKARRKLVEKARKKFFKHGKPINGTIVEDLLRPDSSTAIQNAFSEAFEELGFNYFQLFVVDLMHEVELDTVQELNERFRKIPTFGRSTIRRFVNNVLEMKKLGARDFEDLLQCALTCFEGLFSSKSPEIDRLVQDLLAQMATWHAYAKLWLHTELTLALFEVATKELSRLFRAFASKTANEFDTRLLSREVAAATRCRAAKAKSTATQQPQSMQTSFPKKKIARHECHAHILCKLIKQGPKTHSRITRSRAQKPSLSLANSDPLPFTDPTACYHMSSSLRHFENLTTWLGDLQDDPAVIDFLPKLKVHLLERLLGIPQNEQDFLEDERATITFQQNCIYCHKVIWFNYTMYDMRCNQDSCNPHTRADVMTLSGNENADVRADHPYWFARIIGAFHANVVHSGPSSISMSPQKMDFLFVHWFSPAPELRQYGIHAKRMPKLGFINANNPEAFGFLDPSNVIHGCHNEPAFAFGVTDQFLVGSSIAHQERDKDMDYFRYYVNMWPDHDMFMRFRGGGIRHLGSTLDATCVFEKSNDILESSGESNKHEGTYQEDGDGEDGEEESEEEEGSNNETDNDKVDEDELGPEDGEDDNANEEVYEGFAEY